MKTHKSSKIRFIIPASISVLLMLCSLSFYNLGVSGSIMPLVDMMLVFYWSLYRPKLFPIWFVIILGALRDILTGLPPGVSILLYLMLRQAVVLKRESLIKESFILVWAIFITVMFILSVTKWLILSVIYHQFLPANVARMQYIFTCAIYPVFHYGLYYVNIVLPKNEVNAE